MFRAHKKTEFRVGSQNFSLPIDIGDSLGIFLKSSPSTLFLGAVEVAAFFLFYCISVKYFDLPSPITLKVSDGVSSKKYILKTYTVIRFRCITSPGFIGTYLHSKSIYKRVINLVFTHISPEVVKFVSN